MQRWEPHPPAAAAEHPGNNVPLGNPGLAAGNAGNDNPPHGQPQAQNRNPHPNGP